MNIIDILILVVLAFSIWIGYKKGFILGILDLITWVGSLLAGFFFYPYVAELISRTGINLGVWLLPLAFIITIIFARFIISLIINSILKSTPEEAHTTGVNKFLGIIPGGVNGIIWAIIVSALLLAIPISDSISSQTRKSLIAGRLAENAEWLEHKLSPVFDKAINQSINKLTIKPGSDKSVDLPFTVDDPDVRPDLEQEMLQLVNEERRKEGLSPLTMDHELTPVARKHSADMFAKGYFAHVNKEGKSPSDRIRADGVHFLTAGENLAYAKSLSIAHKGLMNSPGHRANILNPSYGRVGIGILDGGYHGLMITQNFRN